MNTIRTLTPATLLIIAIVLFFYVTSGSAETLIDNSGVSATPADAVEGFYLQEIVAYLVQVLTEIFRSLFG